MSGRAPMNAMKVEDVKKFGDKAKGSLPEPVKPDINSPPPAKKAKKQKATNAPAGGSSAVESDGSGWF